MFSLLYVDDEQGLLELGQLFLESTGEFKVTTALSAEDGLGQLRKQDFDAVVSDFQMPVMDGIAFLKEVRKSFGTVPFILFTGRGREEVVIDAINNGVDFYLQKGGDPKVQFAELAHKVRQAVNRRRAEVALSDSEQRLADIINFLPDATFAIDTQGVVIAWNRAMERMTGVSSQEILGKGNYEYGLPFYHDRRPLLINLVLDDNPAIAEKYPFVKKDGRTLFSEITIPHFNHGRGAELWFTASPLYNRNGDVVGAIESIREITERKRAEVALNESEKRFRELADLLPQGIYESDTGGRMTYANRHALEMSGYTGEDIEKGLNALDVIAPEDRKRAAMALGGIIKTGARPQGSNEYLAMRKDGSRFPVTIISSPVCRDGRIAGLRGVIADITDQRRAADELRAANEQLVASDEELREQYDELALNEKQIRMSETRLTYMLGFYEYAQKSEKELLNYAIEGAGIVTGSALGYLAFLNDDESELAMYAWSKNAMAECSMREKPIIYKTEKTGLWGEAVRQRRPVITNDYAAPNPAKKGYPEGHPRIVRHMNIPVIDDGHIVLVAGVANKSSDYTDADVSELLLLMQGLWTIIKRKRVQEDQKAAYEQIAAADKELRKSEAKFRAVIDQSFQFIGLMDTKGTLIEANRAAFALVGFSEKEVLNRPFWETPWWSHSPELQEKLKDAIHRAASGETVRFEATHPAADGHLIYVDFSVKPVMDEEGRIQYLIPEGRDITDRKQVEDELLRLKISTDRSSDQVFWLDFSGRFLYVNDTSCRDYGYTREEFSAMKIFDLNPEITPEIWAMSVADLRERKNQFITTRHRRKDGSIMDVEIVAVYVNQYDREYSFAYARDITERKRTEDALFNSQQMLQAVLDSIPQRVFWKDRNLIFLGCNRPLAIDAGYADPADLVGKTDYDHASHATADRYRADDRQVMETGQPRINFEEPQIRSDGSHAWLRTTKVPLRNKEGAIIGVLGTYEDITDRKKAEEALRESEEKYRSLVESSFDGIAIHQDGILVYVNRTASRLLGADEPGVFVGTPALDMVAPAFRETIAGRVQQGPISSQDLIHEQFLKTDGTVIDVDVTTTPCTWKGRPAVYVTFRDITRQKHAEEALRESEEKYRMLVEQSRDVIFIIQEDRLVFYNRALEGMTGFTAEELDGRLLADLIAPEDRDLVVSRARDRTSGTAVPDVYEFSLLHKDGTRRIRVRVSAGLASYKGRPASIGTLSDVTEDRRREEALHESEEKYRTLVEVNRDIIYSLSTDGTILYVSPQTLAQLGYRPDEMEGRNFTDFIHPDDTASLLLHIRKNASTHALASSDRFRVRRKDGIYRWYEDTTMYATDSRSRPVLVGTIRDITGAKAAQDALRESEEKFRALVETTGDFIWEVDAGGRYTYVSPQVRQILGYEPGELLGKTPFEIMPPGEAETIAAEFSRCVATKTPLVALENKSIKKDGSVVILETSGVVRTAKDGSYLGYHGIDRDITTRKQAEDALRESEARLSSILHGSPVLQFVIDRNHRVISWNNAIEEYSGIRAADMIGTDQQWRAFYKDKRPVLADLLIDGNTDAINRFYTGKLNKPRYVEGAYEATDFFPLMGRSGIWLSFTAAPIRDNRGVIIGAVETLEDVTERMNAENALRESEERARTILNTAQAGIVIVDATTHEIVDANKKALELIGLDRNSVIGVVCHRFICPAEEGKCPVTDCGQTVNTSERVLMTASGEKIPVLKTVVPVSISGRNVLVESFVDIAEQKRSEAAIREANRKLNLLNSITRHDIRNQLMVAAGFTQLAALSKPDATVMDFLAKITVAIENIQRQIEFTKAYQELGVHAPSWFRVDEVISCVRPEKIALHITCRAVEIFADPMIDKVFFNLFDNAVKYGDHVTTIRVGCEEIDDYLVITFADDGCGIPPAEKKKIFEKGYGKNTGLGLFLAREILAITGITVHENGTFGEGAMFEIIIPKGAYRTPG